MTEQPAESQEVAIQIELPPEIEAGIYADFASIWMNADTFVLDFVATKQPAYPVPDPETGLVTTHILPTKVVARIRVPTSQVWEIARTLTQQLDQWEQQRKGTPGDEPGLPPDVP